MCKSRHRQLVVGSLNEHTQQLFSIIKHVVQGEKMRLAALQEVAISLQGFPFLTEYRLVFVVIGTHFLRQLIVNILYLAADKRHCTHIATHNQRVDVCLYVREVARSDGKTEVVGCEIVALQRVI